MDLMRDEVYRGDTLEKVLVTPEMAAEFLEHNYKDNRLLRKTVVMKYAEDMKNGKWNEDLCDPLYFSDEDELLNGQHRLHAVIMSGTSIHFYLQKGLNKSTYEYMDNGEKRRTSDFISGKHKTLCASLSHVGFAVKYGHSPLSSALLQKTNTRAKVTYSSTRQEALLFYDKNKAVIDDLAAFSKRMRASISCGSPTEYGTALFLIHEMNDSHSLIKEYVDEFCDRQTDNKTIRATRDTITKAYLRKDSMPKSLWACKIILNSFEHYAKCDNCIKISASPKTFQGYENKLENYRNKED